MTCLAMTATAYLIAAAAASNPDCSPGPPPVSGAATGEAGVAELSVLTYNIRALPWPIATRRSRTLQTIGDELAQMRREGRQPDIVLLQEGFRDEVAALVAASGYRYWARGPARSERATRTHGDGAYDRVRYPLAGEGWGKFTGGGLHVLSDLPILEVRTTAYRHCAGLDCLANKGAMLVRVSLPGAPVEIDVVNTHMNSKRAAKVPLSRSLRAHNLQTEQLIGFINRARDQAAPLLVGGDFNVKGAPERYAFMAPARPYDVVSEFCVARASACEGQQAKAEETPWLRSQDLQAFASAETVHVEPRNIETVFARTGAGKDLSDHDGYLVRYQLRWDPTQAAATQSPKGFEMKATFPTVGVKMAWRR